jgi:hypothetical protein
MSTLLQQISTIENAQGATGPGNRQLVIDLADLDAFAAAVEAQFPKVRVNEPAIAQYVRGKLMARTNALGEKLVPYAVVQGGKGHRGEPPGSCTVWYNGKVNLTGVMSSFR